MDFTSVDPRLVGTALLIGSYVLTKCVLQKKTEVIKVEEIWIYPIKSCKGIKLQSSKVAKTGFKYDRQFMLCDEKGGFVSQRKFSKMALISTKIVEDQGHSSVHIR
jgi:hypothetical protein